MKVNQRIVKGEQIEESILEKWKIVLYGLDKGDYAYRRCLGFEGRLEGEEGEERAG